VNVNDELPLVTADVYIMIELPDESLLFLQADGTFTSNAVPYSSNWTISPFMGQRFTYNFGGCELSGNYFWLGAFAEPGTQNWIGGIYDAPFTFRRNPNCPP